MISFERTVEYCLYHSHIESNKNEKNFFVLLKFFGVKHRENANSARKNGEKR